MGELLVLSEEITNLTATYTDITSGYVLIGTDHAIEFVHECLAETHHLSVALATGREVRSTLGTTHRQGCQRVLESLLESKELQDTEVYRLVITQTAFVRANSIVVLDTITHVGLNIALIIYPSDTELTNTIGDAKALDEVCLLKLGVLVVLFLDSRKYLRNCLDVLRLIWEALLQLFYNFCCIHNLFTF